MHGLFNRAIQHFLSDTYGPEVWDEVASTAGVGRAGIGAMMTYPVAVTDAVLQAAVQRLGKPREALLEDIGIFLVTLEPLRRLLRFGGVTYADFIDTLEELPGRAQLAVTEIGIPALRLTEHRPGKFTLHCRAPLVGFGHICAGVLRALADDYGALALIDHSGVHPDGETVDIELLQTSFSEGRAFALAAPEGGAR